MYRLRVWDFDGDITMEKFFVKKSDATKKLKSLQKSPFLGDFKKRIDKVRIF